MIRRIVRAARVRVAASSSPLRRAKQDTAMLDYPGSVTDVNI